MPTISGPITTVSNLTQPVQHARLYLEAARPNGDGIVASFPETLPVTGGTLTFECVEGLAVLELVSAGSRPDRVPILVGKDAEQTLASVAQAAVLADGHTQDQLAEIVDSIRRNRVASEQAAATATDAIGTVTTARDATFTARDAALTARNEAVSAGEAATGAKNTATTARDATLTARNEAEGFKAQAATSAGEAASSAGAASDAADRAENVVDTVQWQGDQLSVMGKFSPPLTGDDGDTPHVGANGNWWVGDTDTGVQARGPKGDAGDGTGDVLWSDLNPVLDGKSDVGHSHSAADVGASPVGHKHPVSDVSDSTTVGRAVVTASSQSAARSAIGAGTSNLELGTTSSTAARGNHTHSQFWESSHVT